MTSMNALTGNQSGVDLLEELLSEFSAEELDSVARQGALFTETSFQRGTQRPRDTQSKKFPFPSNAFNNAF